MDKLRKDNYLFGATLGLLSIVLTAMVLLLGLNLFSKGFNDDPKLFLFSIIPALIFLRWYFKLEYIKTAKAIVLIIVLTFIPFIVYLYRAGAFNTIPN